MKAELKILCFLTFTLLVSLEIQAQNPFRPPSVPGATSIQRRMILFERIEHPVLLKISEQYMMHGSVVHNSGTRLVNARIRRIRGDSLYVDSAGYRFRDLESFDLPNFNIYKRSDSLKWRVFFPPENIYHDRDTYASYMRNMTKQFKKDKSSSVSCRSFHNILKVNITKVINAEIAFDYERRLTDRWTFEVEAGYQFASGYRMGDDFFLDSYPLWKYSGINIVAGPKLYLGRIVYLQMIVIYHYLDMDLSRTKTATSGHYGLQYQYRNDFGGALRFGLISRAFGSMVFDSYIGIGLKACRINQFIYGSYSYDDSNNYFNWYNTDHSADHNHVTLLKPVINLGIKIGIGF